MGECECGDSFIAFSRARSDDDTTNGMRRNASSNVDYASSDDDDADELVVDESLFATPIGWNPEGSFIDASPSSSVATTPTPMSERIRAMERLTSGETRTKPTTSGGSIGSGNARRAAVFERERGSVETATPPAPSFASGGSVRRGATLASVSSKSSVERVCDEVDAVKMRLFEASSMQVKTLEGYKEVLDAAKSLDLGASIARGVVERVDEAKTDARARIERILRRARAEVDTLRKTRVSRAGVLTGKLESVRKEMRELRSSGGGGGGGGARRGGASNEQKVFLTGVASSSSSKHANYSTRTANARQRERFRVLHEEHSALLKRIAFEELRHGAQMMRALKTAANDASMIRNGPTVRHAFDALRAHAAACAPRTRSVNEACNKFVVINRRRTLRATVRAWRREARDQSLMKTCSSIHNARVASAALHHWELFAMKRFWKRKANELAERYACGRQVIAMFYSWLRETRRAKERRIAVRARMFGMSVPEAQRAVHHEVKFTAHDASKAMKSERDDFYRVHCLGSALRSEVVSSRKVIKVLEGMRRFSADDADVYWASSDDALLRGSGAMRKHLDVGLRGGSKRSTDDKLSEYRDDFAASKTAASMENMKLEVETEPDVEALSAHAYELTQSHQRALAEAREATRQCTLLRRQTHEMSLAASRLIANAESRANAAAQGANDALAAANQAEYECITADEEAHRAEKLADELAESWRDEEAVTAALRRATDAARKAVKLSSAHVAAAKVAERASEIAEEHREAFKLVKAQADEDINALRARVLEAESEVMTKAQSEREAKLAAVDAMKRVSAITGRSVAIVFSGRGLFRRRDDANTVYSPGKSLDAEEKERQRRRLTWASFRDESDDDEDAQVDFCGVSLKPGDWRTLSQCATQAHAKTLAYKTLRGFKMNVAWRRRQREAAQLAFISRVFNAWAQFAHVTQTRRKRIESVVDDVLREEREHKLRVYMQCFQKHAKWRRARCDELKLSLRRVVTPTIRENFETWRTHVAQANLFRRVMNRAISAWRVRLARPSHASSFYRLYDAFTAWRAVARTHRESQRHINTAIEYHRVTLALKTIRAWRSITARLVRNREYATTAFVDRTRRTLRARVFARWRIETIRSRARAAFLESYYRRLALRALLVWRAVARANAPNRYIVKGIRAPA